MALLQTSFFSQVLGVAASMNVIIPETEQGIGIASAQADSDRPLPVLYLLHGLSDDHSIWLRRTSIERYAAQYRLAVVMPAVNRSFYTDMAHGYRYWTFISEELPDIVRRLFKVSSRREDTFAAGLSMGGFGSLKLGLNRPERYAAIASLSGAMDVSDFMTNPDNRSEGELVFGSLDAYRGSMNDLYAQAEKLAASGQPRPKIFQCCGTADFLYEDNVRFRQHLETLDYDLTYSEKEGAIHEWGYWDEMVQQVLAWLPLND